MPSFTNSFYKSVSNELFLNILPYWEKNSRDTRPGFEGFYGHIDNDNKKYEGYERSIVMTSRFLWTYSAVARLTKNPRHLSMADFAYNVIVNKFFDKKHGGVYWSVLPDGKPNVSKKQIYGEAFCCYGLSEYAAAVKELRENKGGESLPLAPASDESSATPSAGSVAARNARSNKSAKNKESSCPVSETAMNLALDLYSLMESHARDFEEGGYIEACAKNWKPTDDMILSSKDMNCPKSMNTNLHVLEAYTNLYRTLPVVFPDAGPVRAEAGDSLTDLIFVTRDYILQSDAHLGMFFDMHWNRLDDEVSYGHDIEASWLLWEAACELGGEEIKAEVREVVLRVAETALNEGFDKENGCMENFTRNAGKDRDRRRVWWNQAEAMNGFYNAWQMTGDSKYAEACLAQWKWIQTHQVDKTGGDWWNELDEKGNPVLTEAKGGNWKTSYHNARTCMELLRRGGFLSFCN